MRLIWHGLCALFSPSPTVKLFPLTVMGTETSYETIL